MMAISLLFLLLLLQLTLAINDDAKISLVTSAPRVLTDYSVRTFDVTSSKSCCQLQFVEVDYESVLQDTLNVISVDTTDGTVYPSSLPISSEPTFISQKCLLDSPLKSLETGIFLTNPNNCSVTWSTNSTESIHGNSFVPTFGKYILTKITGTTRSAPIFPVDSTRMFVSRVNYEQNRPNKVETIAEFYPLKGKWPIKSKTFFTRELHKRSILYIRCKRQPDRK